MSSHDPTEVYAARDEIDATLVQTMLAEADIAARVVGGQIMGAVGEVPAGLPSAPRVWVSEEDAEAALRLIRQMEEKRRARWLNSGDDNEETEPPEKALGKQVATVAGLAAATILGAAPGVLASNENGRSSHETGETWACPGCHESVTVEFEICWNCQQPRIRDDEVGGAESNS